MMKKVVLCREVKTFCYSVLVAQSLPNSFTNNGPEYTKLV